MNPRNNIPSWIDPYSVSHNFSGSLKNPKSLSLCYSTRHHSSSHSR